MGRKKLLGIVALLSFLLFLPLVWSFGLVDVPQFPLFSTPMQVESGSSTPTVLVDPNKTVGDYLLDPGFQIDDTFQVHVNISDVTVLFSWQINMSWDPSILNVTGITAGEFLLRTTSVNKTAAYQLGFAINATDNVEGYATMAESVLGDAPGIGVSGSGRLCSIEFLIVGYGWTELTISLTGGLPTTLLNSTGEVISFPPENVLNGWFDNRLRGDTNGDGMVTIADLGAVSDHWTGPPIGGYPYARYCDLDDDGRIGIADWGIVSDNWGRALP